MFVAGLGTEIKFDTRDFDKLHKVSAKKAERAVRQTTNLVAAAAVKNAPHRSDDLMEAICVEFRGVGFDIEGKVVSPMFYSGFVHEGTGIFGPLGMPIFPKEKKALWWPGAAHPVKMVRGQKPQPFLRDALEQEGPKLYDRIFN